MSILWSIIAFIVIFSLLILIHELGHFCVARRAGVKVLEFGMGMPPRAWGKKIGDTIYSINWIPFGGFVKMHGDDPNDVKLLKDPKSFVGKPLRQRMKIVLAGVFMNFLLAWFLLTIGFGFGMQPLIVSVDDAVAAIDSGVMDLEYGISVKEIKEKSIAYEVGLESGDIVTAIDGNPVTDYGSFVSTFEEGSTDDFSVDVRRGDKLMNVRIDRSFDEEIGVEFEQLIFLTHPVVQNVEKGSLSAKAGFRKGDVIISINEKGVYSVKDYLDVLKDNAVLNYKVLRSFRVEEITVDLSKEKFAYVTDVSKGLPAFEAGFRAEDVVVKVNGESVTSINDVVNSGRNNIGKEVLYTVFRNGNYIDLKATPNETGRIGIGLTTIFYGGDFDFDMLIKVLPASIVDIQNVDQPFYKAPFYALSESWRLTKFTASMFMGVVKNVVMKLTVPEGVAGPVGIARLTHVFVQEGMMALLRFTALLSLSLAVINILPFPALDGGRFLFFLVEAVRGKRLNPEWESRIHAIGFLLLMALIFVITWSDIAGLIS
jgi:regulator of sigma E protease